MNSCPNIKILSAVQLKPFPEQYMSKLEKDSLLECSHEEQYQYNYITLYNIITSSVAQTCFGKLYLWCNKVAPPTFSFNISLELELKQEDLTLMLCLRSFLEEFTAPFLPLWLFLFFPSPHSLKHCLLPYLSGHDSLILFNLFHFFFLCTLPCFWLFLTPCKWSPEFWPVGPVSQVFVSHLLRVYNMDFSPFLPGGMVTTLQANATAFVPSPYLLLLPGLQPAPWSALQMAMEADFSQ